MNEILIQSTEKHRQQSFIHVDKNFGKIKSGETYIFCEFQNDAPNKKGSFLGRWLCVDLELKRLDDLTPQIAFLDKNCELEIYKEILTNIRKVTPDDMLVVATFTLESNTKKYWENAPIYS
jgi:hypothetical protein